MKANTKDSLNIQQAEAAAAPMYVPSVAAPRGPFASPSAYSMGSY